jgi:iron complex transport system permease protein
MNSQIIKSKPEAASNRANKSFLVIPLLFFILLALSLLSFGFGRYDLDARSIIKILLDNPFGGSVQNTDNDWVVVQILRIPRIFQVIMSGIGLAMAGAALQGIFRNPLVGPEILGVSSGAAFGGVLVMFLGFSSSAILIPSAFLFGCGALILTMSLTALSKQNSTLCLVLAGVVINGLFGSLTGITTYLSDPESRLPGIVYWLMGSFSSATYNKMTFQAIVSIVCIPLLLGLSWRINLLSLGEHDAMALGIKTKFIRWIIVIIVSLLVSAQVSVSGGIGWVGLVMPHIARMLVGPDHTKLIPVSGLLGGIYLLLMDDLARTLFPTEVPIGILTSMVGTPIFAYFFIKLQGRGWGSE